MANKSSWKKGQSGNPKGRPIGSGELSKRRNEYLSMLMDSCDWEKAIEKLNEEVRSGNIQALKILCDHMLPKQNSNNIEEDINLMDNLTEEDHEKIYDYVASILPKDQIHGFIDASKKVTAFVKEMKSQRTMH